MGDYELGKQRVIEQTAQNMVEVGDVPPQEQDIYAESLQLLDDGDILKRFIASCVLRSRSVESLPTSRVDVRD